MLASSNVDKRNPEKLFGLVPWFRCYWLPSCSLSEQLLLNSSGASVGVGSPARTVRRAGLPYIPMG